MSILKTHQEIIQEFEEKFGVFTVEEEIKSLLTSSTIRLLEAEIENLEGMKSNKVLDIKTLSYIIEILCQEKETIKKEGAEQFI